MQEHIKMELAYLAGLFDGEGCIHIAKPKTTSGYSYSLTISIHQKHSETVKKVHHCFGGNFNECKNGTYTWQCQGAEAGNVLRLVLPFLIEKKEQAELGIDFLETFNYGVGKCIHRSDKEKEFQELYYLKMQILKRL